MTRTHPSGESLELFMRGELEGHQSRSITLHLLGGCRVCRTYASKYSPGMQRPSPSESDQAVPADRFRANKLVDYGDVFRRVLPGIRDRQAKLSHERIEALDLFAELVGHPQAHRTLLAKNSRRFTNWAVCELLLDEGYKLRSKDPSLSLELIELGELVSDGLDTEKYGEALVEDLRGRARVLHANALRIRSDLRAAWEKLKEAERHIEVGTGDPLERARLLRIRAHLNAEHRRWDEAIRSLDQAVRIYRQAGERHLEGIATLDKAVYVGSARDADAAINLLKVGLDLVDQVREPRAVAAAKHNLVHFLCESGRFHQAKAMIPQVRTIHAQLDNTMDSLRLLWLEGKVALGHGDLEGAASTLRAARRGFAEREIAFDTALVSLDLAVVLLRTGQNDELKLLAAQMVGVFRALDVHREAIAALVLFQKAVELERATANLAGEIALFLHSARTDLRLRFRP